MISDDILKRIMPRLPEAKRVELLPPLQRAMIEFEVTTPKREAAFLAQIAHESAELTRFVENLNYGAIGLIATFTRYFPGMAQARQYERNQEKIADHVYANRLGNGDEASGDGWRYRGRGPIQITGRDNYAKYGSRLGVDLISNPDQAAVPEVGFRIAGLYWRENGLNALADAEMIETITERINGKRKLGLADRIQYYTRAKEVLGILPDRDILVPESDRGVSLPPVFTRGSEELTAERARKPRKSSPRKAKRATPKPGKKKAGKNGTKRGRSKTSGKHRPTRRIKRKGVKRRR
jgi:putative chitinase